MKIKITNLGPVKEATLDIGKRLTVFCGPNNSGKTYAAFLIYGLTKLGSIGISLRDSGNIHLSVRDLIKDKKVIIKTDIEDLWKYRTSEIETIRKSLNSIYGISNETVEKLFGEFDLGILQTKAQLKESIKSMSFQKTMSVGDSLSLKITKKAFAPDVEVSVSGDKITKEDIHYIELFLQGELMALIAFYPFTSSHILPVERNSIYTFSKELSLKKQEFIDKAQDLNTNGSKDSFYWLMKRATRYPLAIRDGLQISEDLSNFSMQKTDFYGFAEEIEQSLLQGKVSVTKEGEVQFASNKAKRKKIPIHLTASIVKTLSGLVFYLKYMAAKNDLIIIDEPELNLHPDNQVILARIFAKMLNKGFRLLISTHSDYIIRELNNLMMLYSDKEGIGDIIKKYNYSIDEKIAPEQVAAYLFNYKGKAKSVTVSSIPITEEGFEVSTIDNTIDKLNEISEELFYTLKYGIGEQVG